MHIFGLQKLAMVDYPGKLAATVFTGGCNLRCPFCHNALLVTRLAESNELDPGEGLAFLASRRGLLDGVVLSGGEPLLQPDAMDFLRQVRNPGFAVKLVDYVAMDVKNCREKYPLTCGDPAVDPAAVEESARLLADSGVDYELRTTLVRELHAPGDVAAIGRWLGRDVPYYLQNFVDSGNLIGSGFHGFSLEELAAFTREARPWFPRAAVRGQDNA